MMLKSFRASMVDIVLLNMLYLQCHNSILNYDTSSSLNEPGSAGFSTYMICYMYLICRCMLKRLIQMRTLFLQNKYLYQSTSCSSSSWWIWLWCSILWWMGLVTILILRTGAWRCSWHRRWIRYTGALLGSWCCYCFSQEGPWENKRRR